MLEDVAPTEDALKRAIDGKAALNQFFGFSQESLEAMAVLGFNLFEQGKNEDAKTVFRGLIALDSTQFFGYAGLGALALAEEKSEEAVGYLETAAELNPNDPTIQANFGEALLRQARFEEAATHFEKALELDPDEVDGGANRARAILEGMEILMNEFQRLQA